jgi:hypothetical protein
MALGRFFLFFGLVAVLSLIGAGFTGYGLFGPPADRQLLHSGLAFVAVLAAVFSNGWFVLFLWRSGRSLRRLSQGREALAGSLSAASRSGRLAGWTAFLATAAFIATFLSGNLSFGNSSWRLGHHALSIASLALQATALWLERRALTADDRLAAALDAPAGLGAPGIPHAA